jgi:hypothetical protein
MWKVKDPDAGALSVERKDEFTIRAAERADAEAVKKK